MFENMTVQVGWDTTNEQVDELERRINNWLSQDEKRDLASSTAIMVRLLARPCLSSARARTGGEHPS